MNNFQIRIVKLDSTVHEGDAVHCRVRTMDGSLGLEARHEPFLAALKPGSTIEIRGLDGQIQQFTVTDAMLSFNNNRCLILMG